MSQPVPPGPWWKRNILTIAVEQMSHRPRLPRRWMVYCVVAYLVPIVALGALPESLGNIREVSWLMTLAPAFILSLHYGMVGALIGLVAGTVLYVAVQLVFDLQLVQVNQEVLLPIYVSYGMLAIAVGWLSQQLHDFYGRLVKNERLAAIGQVTVTLHHQLGNALQTIAAEVGILKTGALGKTEMASVEKVQEMVRRIQADMDRLSSMSEAATTTYVGETKMVKLES